MTSPIRGDATDLALRDAQVKVPESFTTNLRAALADPLFNVPDAFVTWLVDQVGMRGLGIPIGQVIGFSQFTFNVADTILAQESTSSVTYTNLATVGPSLSGLSDGSYLILFGAQYDPPTTTDGPGSVSLEVNGVAASDNDSAVGSAYEMTLMRAVVKQLTSGANTLTVKYRTNAGTPFFKRRWLVAVKYANI